MDIKSALESATTIIKSNHTTPSIHNMEVNNIEFSTDMMNHFFNVDNPDQKTSEQLNEIFDWAKERQGEDEDVLSILKDVRFKLGSPSLGENPVDQMYRYVFLRKQASSAEMTAKSMER